MKKITQEEFLAKVKEKNKNNFDYSKVNYKGYNNKVTIICNNCKTEFEVDPKNLVKGSGCPECAKKSRKTKKRKTTEQFIQEAKEIHGDKYDYSLVNYINNKTNIEIICKEHGSFLQSPKAHLMGCGCKKCSLKNNDSIIEYNKKNFEKAKGKFFEKAKKLNLDTSKATFEKVSDRVILGCPKHGEFTVKVESLIKSKKGNGCPLCKKEKLFQQSKEINEKFKKEFIPKLEEEYSDFDFSKTNYINWKTPIGFTCKKCGNSFEYLPSNIKNGIKCSFCNSGKSAGEIKIANFLKSKKIYFKAEYYFKDLRDENYLRYDFYIPSKNLLIEYDGEQHFNPKSFGGESEFKIRKKHDSMKDEYAKNNNIKLLRISYTQFKDIETILDKLTI